MLKKFILTFIGIALLLSFQTTTASAAYYEKLTISDVAPDSENSKNENCESGDWKFFSYAAANFFSLKLSWKFIINSDSALQQNFSEVPTSPPNV